MSSRRSAKNAAKNEHYRTPEWVIDRLAQHLRRFAPVRRFATVVTPCLSPNVVILDPCAGHDVYRQVLAKYLWPSKARFISVDIEQYPGPAMDFVGDFLTMSRADLGIGPNDELHVISNPPFSLAVNFVEHCLDDLGAVDVLFLQRLNWLGSAAREAFWVRDIHRHIFVEPQRISFTPDGQADSIEYGHFAFAHGEGMPTLSNVLAGK